MLDTTQFLKDLAAKWTSKHPEHADRIARGLAIAEAGKVAPRGLDSFKVCGSAPGVEYIVEVNCGFPRCSCPDFARRAHRCKHVWASALMVRLTAAIVESLTEAPKPRPVQRPRRNDLSNRCETFHAVNYQAAQDLRPLAKVIPFRK